MAWGMAAAQMDDAAITAGAHRGSAAAVRARAVRQVWSATPADPLIVLLAHSDCDGVIHPEQAAPLADRLEDLLPRLDADGGGHLARMGGHRGATEQFIKGLRAAVDAGEDLDFH